MSVRRGNGDGLRGTEGLAGVGGGARAAAAGSEVRASPAVTAAAATTTPVRLMRVGFMAVSSALGCVVNRTPRARRRLAELEAVLSSAGAPGHPGGPRRRTTPHAAGSDVRRAR